MTSRTILSLALLAALSAGPARSAFTVHRAPDASGLLVAPALATVGTSPWEGTGLADGTNAFFLVRDGSGTPVRLHADADRASGTLLLSFEDGDPASAPVDAVLSEVNLSPASVPADGATPLTVRVIPRDARGLPLGTGLAVSLDPASLWPGRTEGPVLDLGNGTYEVELVANIPGRVSVTVAVEGVPLAARPEAEFLALPDKGTLRDQAIVRLLDLTAPDGLLDRLGPADARRQALRALSLLATTDGSRDDQAVRAFLKQAVETLMASGPDATALVDALLDTARLLSLHHLQTAEAACGPCVPRPGRSSGVCAAEEALTAGDAAREEPGSDPSAVLDLYALSITRSTLAEGLCLGRPGRRPPKRG